MAIDASHVAEKPIQVLAKSQAADQKKTVTMRRDAILNEHGTGITTKEHSDRRKGMRGQEVTFSEELKTQYVTFMEKYVNRLTEVERDFPEIFQNGNHAHDLKLLARFRTQEGKIDLKKVEEFVKTSEGLGITTQLLEEQTSLQMYALGGIRASARPRGERQMGLTGDRSVTVEWDEGILHNLVYNVITPKGVKRAWH